MSGLYTIKPWFVGRLRGVEDLLVAMRVPADALTSAAVAAAGLAGIAIAGGAAGAPLLWLAVAPLALIRIALNALDGSVARRTGTARPFGAVLNEVGDRVADGLFLLPLALVAPPVIAVGAFVAALLASFVGVVSLGVAGTRDHAGPMGKADRMLVVGFAAVVAPVASVAWTVAAALIGAGALVTIAVRIARLHRACEPSHA